MFFNATAIILAGGRSSRMGQDKSLLSTNDIPLIGKIASQLEGHFPEIIVSANDMEKYRVFASAGIPDLEAGKGPLMGIYSALLCSEHEINFVVACDIPELDMQYIQDLIKEAKDHQIVVPVWSDGRLEPLFAVYKSLFWGI